MAQAYLGSTALNQLWLGNDEIGKIIQVPITSLFQVFPQSSVANYWNQLSVDNFETSSGAPRLQKWYDSITNSYISSSDGYPLPGQSPLRSSTISGSVPTYIGIGDGGINARVFFLITGKL